MLHLFIMFRYVPQCSVISAMFCYVPLCSVMFIMFRNVLQCSVMYTSGFDHHINHEHHIWAYIFFFIHLHDTSERYTASNSTYTIVCYIFIRFKMYINFFCLCYTIFENHCGMLCSQDYCYSSNLIKSHEKEAERISISYQCISKEDNILLSLIVI